MNMQKVAAMGQNSGIYIWVCGEWNNGPHLFMSTANPWTCEHVYCVEEAADGIKMNNQPTSR